MIYRDLKDLESFIRINTLNDLKTKEYQFKEDDYVFVLENLTFYKISATSNIDENYEGETLDNKKIIKIAKILREENVSDLNTLTKEELMNIIESKEPVIVNKRSGFNLEVSDSDELNSSNTLASSVAIKKVKDFAKNIKNNLESLNLSWGNINSKPSFSNSVDSSDENSFATPYSIKKVNDKVKVNENLLNSLSSNFYNFKKNIENFKNNLSWNTLIGKPEISESIDDESSINIASSKSVKKLNDKKIDKDVVNYSLGIENNNGVSFFKTSGYQTTLPYFDVNSNPFIFNIKYNELDNDFKNQFLFDGLGKIWYRTTKNTNEDSWQRILTENQLSSSSIITDLKNNKEPTITIKKSGFNLDKTDSLVEDNTNKLATAKSIKILNDKVNSKEPSISKKTGFNLDKTNSYEDDDSDKLATGKALKLLFDEIKRRIGSMQLTWSNITGKPSFSNSINSNSENQFATPKAVKIAYEQGSNAVRLANEKLPLSGGTIIGNLEVNGNINSSGTIQAPKVLGAWYNDYAERFPKEESTMFEEGDVVALDINSVEERYVVADKKINNSVVGVYSENPGILIGGEKPEWFNGSIEEWKEKFSNQYVNVALTGRVKVKFIGKAKKGRRVVLSKIEGTARLFDPLKDNYIDIIGILVEDDNRTDLRKLKIKI